MTDQIATNPQTGESVILRNGQWQPLQVATNPQTHERVALIDNQWQPLPSGEHLAPAAPRRTAWNAREREAVANSTYLRRSAASALPGIGLLAEPLGALMADPRQRAAVGRNISGAIDAVRTQHIDLPRLLSDTATAGHNAWNDLPNLPGRVLSHLPQIAEGMTTGPMTANDEARNQELVSTMRGNEAGANREAGNAAASTGGIATNMLGALLGPLARTPLQGAGLAAALTAPNALANGSGTLQERLPQAIVDTAGAGAIGAGLPLLARNARPRAAAAGPGPNARLQDFETAGVRPTLAATAGGSAAGATKTISENWLGGMTARAGLNRSIEDTAARAHEMAGRVGEVQSPELAGEGVQAGVRRFAQDGDLPQPHAGDPASIPVREWSFPAKAEALYNRAFDALEHDEQAMTGHVGEPVVTAHNTISAIDGITNSVRGGESRTALAPRGFLAEMRNALATDSAPGNLSLSFRDLRRWRTELRERMRDPGLRGDTSSTHLSTVYEALTRDIRATAQNIGGQAAVDLPRIDRWYRAGTQRIERALAPFNEAGGGMGGGRQAYQRIIALASRGPQQNSQQLRALASSLRPDEMRSVGATLLDEIGRPLAGKAGALEPGAFSPTTFATNWARLSEAGKSALFPPELRRELDALARVADYQRGVEAMANHSRTAVSGQNIATAAALTGAGAMHQIPLAIGGLALMNLTGEMLTNPRFVRWLTGAAQARANGQGVRRALGDLRRLAARDPALIPAYNAVTRAQAPSQPQSGQRQPAELQLAQ